MNLLEALAKVVPEEWGASLVPGTEDAPWGLLLMNQTVKNLPGEAVISICLQANDRYNAEALILLLDELRAKGYLWQITPSDRREGYVIDVWRQPTLSERVLDTYERVFDAHCLTLIECAVRAFIAAKANEEKT